MSHNLGLDPFPAFQTLSAILGPPGSHFGFCRQCGIAGGAELQAVRRCRWCGVAGGPVLQAVRCCKRCGVAGGAVLQAVWCCRQ